MEEITMNCNLRLPYYAILVLGCSGKFVSRNCHSPASGHNFDIMMMMMMMMCNDLMCT